jgi:hypothetical protein
MLKNLNDYDLISGFFLFHQQQTSTHSFTLDDFNLNELLASGQRLLGTSTQKYEPKDAVDAHAKTEEMIKQQRSTLYMKLGIDVAGAAKLDTRHIFSDEDLIAANVNDDSSNASSSAGSSSSKRKETEPESSSLTEASNKKVTKT